MVHCLMVELGLVNPGGRCDCRWFGIRGRAAVKSINALMNCIAPADSSFSARYARPVLAAILMALCVFSSVFWIQTPILRSAIIVASVCLTLWLTEVVPPY